MWSKNGPVTGQIIKVVHDDGYKKVDDLKKGVCNIVLVVIYWISSESWVQIFLVVKVVNCEEHQECTEHVEADEIDDGEAAAAGPLLSGVVVWLGITQLPWQTGQHDLLPRLTCGTPESKQEAVQRTCWNIHFRFNFKTAQVANG